MKRIIFLLAWILFSHTVIAQQPSKPNASEIYKSIKKLNFLGSVLYVGAHPDDENTQFISYFSNHENARTAYLSMTRGDGGQNLIGPELRELLGVIRTQELLAARKIDGGEQFFTRANDFGYSKHPEETKRIWGKDEVLKDVVSIIRKFRPDVIINRFDYRTPGTTHGHHTTSAMLSYQAFDLANDSTYKAYGLYNIWKPKRLFFNTSWWFYGSRERFEKADKSNMMNFDVGVYYPLLGLSNNEIAALSRSKHKSQGFGATGRRGSNLEYVELLKGELPKDKTTIFDGIDTSWNRIERGNEIGNILYNVEKYYDFKDPSASIPKLIKAYKLINNLKDDYWRTLKLKQIKKIIADCAGLYLEAVSDEALVTPNSNVNITIEAINRSKIPIQIDLITFQNNQLKSNVILTDNQDFNLTSRIHIDSKEKFTSPYWLRKKGTLGLYSVDDKNLIGLPETPRNLAITFNVVIEGTIIKFTKNIIYKYTDPVKGEVYQPLEVVPEVTTSIQDEVIIFSDNLSKQIPVTITAFKDTISGSLTLCHPDGWKVSPEKVDFTINKKNQKKTILFNVTPPTSQNEGLISPLVIIDGKDYTKNMVQIGYNHIPKQTVLLPSQTKIVRLDIKTKGKNIGYIQGAGDNIPNSLRQIGYTVIELNEDDITVDNLQNFDAVILGIRTYNVSDKAKFYQKELHEYVNNGGTLIVQYNTNRGLKIDKVAPYNLELSRDRVVEEDAKVVMINPTNQLLNYPNKITNKDFEGWVQERGLYFPNKWDSHFKSILSMHDTGDEPLEGSLLVAKYGKGHFIYTGLSFFRELPVGVPGAYKLFANLIAIGEKKSIQLKN